MSSIISSTCYNNILHSVINDITVYTDKCLLLHHWNKPNLAINYLFIHLVFSNYMFCRTFVSVFIRKLWLFFLCSTFINTLLLISFAFTKLFGELSTFLYGLIQHQNYLLFKESDDISLSTLFLWIYKKSAQGYRKWNVWYKVITDTKELKCYK